VWGDALDRLRTFWVVCETSINSSTVVWNVTAFQISQRLKDFPQFSKSRVLLSFRLSITTSILSLSQVTF
jgi:hypothetical protein